VVAVGIREENDFEVEFSREYINKKEIRNKQNSLKCSENYNE
jgi:phosphopantetheine adenylyltransferase